MSLPVLEDENDPRDWEIRAWVTLVRVYGRVERRLAKALGAYGLSVAQFDVLATLLHGEGITQQELSERLLVTKGNVVGLVDRVSAAGWIERRPDPDDRRVNRLYLTDAGRALLRKALPGQHASLKSALRPLLEAELKQIHTLLKRVDDALPDTE